MFRRSRTPRAVLIALLWLLTAAWPALGPNAGAAPDDPGAPEEVGQSQDAVRQQQADLASELDVLRATSEQVGTALATIEANVRNQQAATAAAMGAAEQAKHDEGLAIAQVEATVAEVARLKQRVEELAVNLYLRPPGNDAVQAIIGTEPGKAPQSLALVRFRVEDVTDTLAATEAARDRLALDRIRAGEARLAADRTAEAEAAHLAELQMARDQQQSFAQDVAARIERALGEAAMLWELDAELSAEIQRRELQLAAQLAASVAETGAAVLVIDGDDGSGSSSDGAATDPAAGDSPAGAEDPTNAAPAEPAGPGSEGADPSPTSPPASGGPSASPAASPAAIPPTSPAVVPRTIVVVPVDTTWVHGIEVASSIAESFEALMAAAEADGIHLGGSGYRNILRQIELRRDHCGPTDYDIWLKPSWECSPPVARPGTSMHEKGVAIDFAVDVGTEDEDLIRTRDHPAFQWLTAYNARTAFLRNLDLEPWHWSTTGQ